MPNWGQKAVPEIDPEPRPIPPQFTLKEYEAMPFPVKGKIAKNQVDNRAYQDIMETKLQIFKDYIRDLFSETLWP